MAKKSTRITDNVRGAAVVVEYNLTDNKYSITVGSLLMEVEDWEELQAEINSNLRNLGYLAVSSVD